MQSLIDPTLPLESDLKDDVFQPMQPLVDPTLAPTSEFNIAHIILTSSYFFGQRGIPSMVPLPIPKFVFFDWNHLVEPFLPSYVPFQNSVELFSSSIYQSIIDEGDFISILSYTTWKDLYSPNLMPPSS